MWRVDRADRYQLLKRKHCQMPDVRWKYSTFVVYYMQCLLSEQANTQNFTSSITIQLFLIIVTSLPSLTAEHCLSMTSRMTLNS